MITIFRWGCDFSGGLVVQFLHENKLNSEIFIKEKKFINKSVFLCQFKLGIQLLLKDGMGIKDKKIVNYGGSLENLILEVGS